MIEEKFYVEEGSSSVGSAVNENKKQVVLIGDSIREGYCEYVKEELKDIADVYFPPVNCRNTQFIITSLRLWLNICDPEKVDVVHFNAGHWDIGHWSNIGDSLTTKKEYAKNITKIVKMINLFFPNAKIMFATTTPMNPNTPNVIINNRTTKEIMAYNKRAKKTCKKLNVPVNDLFELAITWGEEMFKDYCHLVDDGYKLLAKQVSSEIKKLF